MTSIGFILSAVFWWNGLWIVGVLVSAFILMEFKPISIVHVFFWLSYSNLLRNAIFGMILISWAIVGTYYFFKLPRADKTRYLVLACVMCVFLIYAFLVSVKTFGENYGGLVVFCGITFLVLNLRKQIGFKTALYCFIAGLLVTSFIGLFVEQIYEIKRRTYVYTVGDLRRFDGLTGNPNRYQLYIIAAICGLFILDLRKNIRPQVFYPMAILIFSLGFTTVSRTYMVAAFIIVFAYIVIKVTHEKRQSIRPIFIIGIAMVCILGVMFQYTQIYWERLGGIGLELESEIDPDKEFIPPEDRDKYNFWNNYNDAPRPALWALYIKDWVSSSRVFFFGNGLDSPNPKNFIHPHNLYIWLLDKTGIIGLVLFAAIIGFMINIVYRRARFQFGFDALLFLLTFAAISFFELQIFRMQGYIFILFYVLSLSAPDEETSTATLSKPLPKTEAATVSVPADSI